MSPWEWDLPGLISPDLTPSIVTIQHLGYWCKVEPSLCGSLITACGGLYSPPNTLSTNMQSLHLSLRPNSLYLDAHRGAICLF